MFVHLGPIKNSMCPMMIGNLMCETEDCSFTGYMDEVSMRYGVNDSIRLYKMVA